MNKEKSVSKTKQTFKLMLISAINLLVTSVLSLIHGRVVLTSIGSDYNGLNSIVAQFIMIITLAEGGFTTASLVALFKPSKNDDLEEVNNVLGETARQFKKIGVTALVIAIFFSVGYALFIHTNIAYFEIVMILLISSLTSIVSIVFLTRYRLLFQLIQKEHIYTCFLLCFNAFSSVGSAVIIYYSHSVIFAKLFQFLCIAICALVVGFFVSRTYQEYSYKTWDKTKRVKGTGDVLITKIVGVMHTSSSTLFLSIFANTLITSVYSVYYNVVHIISSVVNISITSTQNALGKTIHEQNEQKTKNIFLNLELIVLMVLTVLLIPTWVLIVPFVNIYTAGVTDVVYTNYPLAALLILSIFFQLAHIPSGLMIYLSGQFKVAKKIQTVGLVVLLTSSIVMGFYWDLYGILFARLLCDLVLAAMEIYYAHKKAEMLKQFSTYFGINFALLIGVTLLLYPIGLIVSGSVLRFCIVGGVILFISALMVLSVNALLFRSDIKELFTRLKQLLHKNK